MSLKKDYQRVQGVQKSLISETQSLLIVSTFLKDILVHLYDADPDGITVDWGEVENGFFAFQINFDPSSTNEQSAFEEFLHDYHKIQYDVMPFFDEHQRIIAFPDLEDTPEFLAAFMIQNNWLTEEPVELSFATTDQRFKVTEDDLLKLKRDFYWSWSECAAEIKMFENNDIRRLGRFIFTLYDLERSIETNYTSSSNQDYNPAERFRFH